MRTTVNPCASKKRSISCPVGRGSLGMGPGEIVEVPIELAQRGRDIEAREGVVEAKGIYISAERLLQIGDRFLLRVPLAIGGDVGHTGGEPADFRVRDEFNGQLL